MMTAGWPSFSPTTSAVLADLLGYDERDLERRLHEDYGPAPTTGFVQDAWMALRSTWLAEDDDSRHAVLEELRGAGNSLAVGPGKSSELAELSTARHDADLRIIVLGRLLADDGDVTAPGPLPTPDRSPQGSTVGETLVSRVQEALSIDGEWIEPLPGGFAWWAYQHRQVVLAGQPIRSRDLDVTMVRATTDLGQATAPIDLRRISQWNTDAALEAVVFDPADGTLSYRSTVCGHSEVIGWLGGWLAAAALRQVVAAEQEDQLLLAVGATPLRSGPPGRPPRLQPDEILAIGHQWALGDASGPRWQPDARLLLSTFEMFPNLVARGEPSGVVRVELPQEKARGLKKLSRGQRRPVLSAWFEEHARLGLGVRFELDPAVETDDPATTANTLNLAESVSFTGTHLLGAWSSEPNLRYRSFLPAFLVEPVAPEQQPIALFNMAVSIVVRHHWLQSWLSANQ